MNKRRVFSPVFLLLLVLLTAACNDNNPSEISPETAVPPTNPTNIPAAAPSPTLSPPTAVPPTPTPSEPIAALVNDQPIFLAAYERELARYEQAQVELGTTPGADGVNYRAVVLDTLIERALITQAAAREGITVFPESVTAKLAELEATAGEAGNFDAWLEANQWTREEFEAALADEMLVEAVVTAVTADVPTTVEQVKARYLQVDDMALAESLLQQIRDGGDFGALARQYSLDTHTAQNGGDLDYFARGSLLIKPVEDVAFTLEPGQTSDVITVTDENGAVTYYLVQVIERDPQRPLSADMRYTMLQQAFESWLDGLWQDADITRFVGT